MEIIVADKNQLEQIINRAVIKAVESRNGTGDREPDEVLTDREAQKFLRKSRSTLQRWRNEGILPFKKVNGSVLYRRSDLLSILTQAG